MLLLKLIKRSIVLLLIVYVYTVVSFRKYTKEDVHKLREEVREMFEHAYSSYLRHAYPYDELRPLSCDGVDTWGSYSLTLIDALDTLAVMGNFTEFQRVVKILTSKSNFDANINVSVFETNIRIVGGLLSAHLLSHRAGVELEPGWPCNGPLLRLAEDVARRLLPAFDTPTGMPYGTVNLRHGVPLGETTITCTAGIGTFVLEFGALSRLTGDPVYEEVALNALHALRHYRSSLGLVGNHIDVATGRWTALDAGIGAGVDSYYEYLAKGAVLLQRPELMKMFQESRVAIDRHLKRDDWHLWVTMTKGQVTLPVFQSLEAYWPGLLSLVGDISTGMKSLHNYHQVWKQYGFTPEFYNIPQGEVGTNREGYPLRPELAESVMYLARATGDPYLLEVGVDILRSIQHSARTPCGYATIKDTRDHRQEDRMESFFLAETTKYLYLLFDPDNFIHNRGQHGTLVKTHWGECVMEAGGYIFNTEAHPLDPGALHCCSEARENPFTFDLDSFRGETLQAHQRRTERQRYLEKQKQKQRQHQRQQEDNARAAEKTVRVTLDAGLTPPSSPVSTSPQESLSPPPPPPSKAEVTVDTDRTAGRKPGNSGDPKESRLVGIGEVVEVQWHTKSEDDVVWHNKAESEDEIRLLSRGQDIKKKQTGDGQIVGYRANENRITPIREGDGPAYTGPFDMTGETVTGISGGAISSSGASASNEEMSAGRNKDKNNDNSSDNRSEKLVELNSDTKEESDDENSEIDRKEGISKQAVLTEPPTLSSIFGNFLFTSKSNTVEKPPFDPQDLLERIRMRPQYSINSSWSTEFDVLSCGVQPFLQRVSMSGEFFPNS